MHRVALVLLSLVVACLVGAPLVQAAPQQLVSPPPRADEPADTLLNMILGEPAQPVSVAPHSAELELTALLAGRGPDAACHGWITCPSPKSCGSWSSYTDCDSPCCDYACPGGLIALVQLRERFRHCVLGDGSSCYEYQTNSFVVQCGCFGNPAC